MRPLLLAVMLLFAGCLAQEAAPQAAQDQAAAPQNLTPNSLPQESPQIPEVSANLTVPETAPAATDWANATAAPPANATVPENGGAGGEQAEGPGPAGPPEGMAFGNGSYVLAFDDASIVPVSEDPCGIFSIWLENGTLMEKLFICPGGSEIWHGPDGKSYRIRVVQVAAGYSGAGKWAKVIIYG